MIANSLHLPGARKSCVFERVGDRVGCVGGDLLDDRPEMLLETRSDDRSGHLGGGELAIGGADDEVEYLAGGHTNRVDRRR